MFNDVMEFNPSKSPFFHVAIIPDGGRRWAKEHRVDYRTSYDFMVDKLCEISNEMYKSNVDIVSIYCSSVYNFKRPIEEIKSFCDATAVFMKEKILPIINKHKVRVHAVGNIKDCSISIINAASYIETKSAFFDNKKMYLCINYSSMIEIGNAMSMANTQPYVNNLEIPYPVNCLIRTGGAHVLSDFLLPQCAFSRFFFFDKLFNDLTIEDIHGILNSYSGFELKYGE